MAASGVHISIIVHRGTPLDYPQYRHTALWLRFSDHSPDLTAEIVGAHGFFEFQTRDNADPYASRDFVRAIDVGYLTNTFTKASIVQALSRVLVDNRDREYNCQTWVQVALNMLMNDDYLPMEGYGRGLEQMVDAIAEAGDSEE
ncbi:hypothetical protein LTR95_007849 [Oleoguttula sp. CCFEE 5521]